VKLKENSTINTRPSTKNNKGLQNHLFWERFLLPIIKRVVKNYMSLYLIILIRRLHMQERQFALTTALVASLFAAIAPQAKAEIQKYNFEVVGTWGNLENWKSFESKFWKEQLPKASGGKLTANAKPYTELGLKGFEVMSGLKKGAFDGVHALTSYSVKASPALEALILQASFKISQPIAKLLTPIAM